MGFLYTNREGKSYEINYQDVWVGGELFERGGRECELRFWAIYKALKELKRPLKVLDIGANMGYFSIRLAEKLEGLFVMAEGTPYIADRLVEVVKLNDNPKLVVLRKFLTLSDLKQLKSEQFDVVLALSVIHHFKEPYQEVLETLTDICEILIFEPPVVTENTYNQARINSELLDLSKLKKRLLTEVPTGLAKSNAPLRPTWLIECGQKASVSVNVESR